MIPRIHWGAIAIKCFLAILLFSHYGVAVALEGVCAEVRIEILQTVSLERQAFDATLRIRNGLTTVPVEDIYVALDFRDITDVPVVGTTDPDAVEATFFYREDGLINISDTDGTGVVAPETVAEARWLIIPAPGSGGTEGLGQQYFIGATITYSIAGEAMSVDVIPEIITVRPQPILELDYFLQEKVYADDPFTPEVEPSEPFTLGVRVQNVGGGVASNVAIDSAQPKIIENELGLLIGFQIDSSFVDDNPAAPTLLINFGDIASGATRMGRWLMSTTLAGEFTEFESSFTHSDGLGGELTSLIQRVDTHFLVHDVKMPLPGRDDVRDFLALDGDFLRIYESDGLVAEVEDQSELASLSPGLDEFTLTVAPYPGPAYVQLEDPTSGKAVGISATRGDGTPVPSENIWFSKKRNPDLNWLYFINIFDADLQGSYTISMTVSAQADLAVSSLNVTPLIPETNSNATLTTSIVNNGPDVSAATVQLGLPDNFIVNSTETASGIYDVDTSTWSTNEIASAETVELAIAGYFNLDGTGVFSATVEPAIAIIPDPDISNNYATIDVTVTLGAPLQISLYPVIRPSILVLVGCEGDQALDVECIELRAEDLFSALAPLPYDYQVSTDLTEFTQEMRSGRWNVYWIIGSTHTLSTTFVGELQEAARRGEAVILEPRGPTTNLEIDRIAGVEFDKLAAAKPLTVTTTKKSGLTPVSFPMGWPAQKLKVIDATEIAVLSNNQSTILRRDVGRSAIYSFGYPQWRMMSESVEAFGMFEELILMSMPEPYDFSTAEAFQCTDVLVQREAFPIELQVSELLPLGFMIESANPVPNMLENDFVEWLTSVGTGMSFEGQAQYRTPLQSGTYSILAMAENPSLALSAEGSQTLDVLSVDDLASRILSALSSLSVKKNRQGYVDEAIEKLLDAFDARANGDLETCLQLLSGIADGLVGSKISGADTIAIETAFLLKSVEREWFNQLSDLGVETPEESDEGPE
jgi:hypothetical protein